jgi:hypothetical protein
MRNMVRYYGRDERVAAEGRRIEGPSGPTGTTLMEVTRDLETLTRQERELILAHFDPEIAWQLGLRLRDLAVSRHHAVAIEVRRFGQQLFYSALAGAAPNNAEWIRRKGNTVQRFYRSSYAVGLDLRQKNSKSRTGLTRRLFLKINTAAEENHVFRTSKSLRSVLDMQNDTLFTFCLAVSPTEGSQPYREHPSSRRTHA